jgi:hypothetical protein
LPRLEELWAAYNAFRLPARRQADDDPYKPPASLSGVLMGIRMRF